MKIEVLKMEFLAAIAKKETLKIQVDALQNEYFEEAQFSDDEGWKESCWNNYQKKKEELAELNTRMAEIRKIVGPPVLRSWRNDWNSKLIVKVEQEKATCCMCEKETNQLFLRKDGDEFCKECHEKYCQHINNETIPVANGLVRITVCHDCGCEI